MTQAKHTFNNIEYSFTVEDGRWAIVRADGKSLGSSAALHGAIDAAVSDAFPREPRRSLRVRPD